MTEPKAIFVRHKSKKDDSDEIMESFFAALKELKISPYDAQEEAILELMSGNHLILATPTGSGKSLVAYALLFKAFCENKKAYYTCPIKALVSEKFFSLCEMFGAENVGMITGDASINKEAKIICCTAEVLSNFAISEGKDADIHYVVMDEFHYFSDTERGVAWQVPLLSLPQTTFLLMSATIGDAQKIKDKLKKLTGKDVSEVSSLERPVPLNFSYSEKPLHETLSDLVQSKKYPIYVVNFTQAECYKRAQDSMSVNICTKEEKQKILEVIKNFRFDTPLGKEIKRFLSHGVGIHNAGILPKYRLLVEKLAQNALLKIIMGTDTLGVGVNVPIRTVLFTRLYKFDGVKRGILSVRDFKQIAGRAGRKGFDDEGFVLAQAPEHVIENLKQENKFSKEDLKRKRKSSAKKVPPPKDFVHYDKNTFQKLIDDPPESLQSQYKVSHGMILNALIKNPQSCNKAYRRFIDMVEESFESDYKKSRHRKTAALLFKSLLAAKIISIVKNIKVGPRIVINDALQEDFSLHHSLDMYLLEALAALKESEAEYALDVLSLTESIEENPKIILQKQLDKKKTQAINDMKAQGVEYDERMERLDKIEYDKPLADFIYQTFNLFALKHPWLKEENIHPKSIARVIFESGSTFNEYINELGLSRAEGVLLRYLSQVYKTLVQTIPLQRKNDDVLDIIAYFKTMLSKTDTSLIDEWESMFMAKEELEQEQSVEVVKLSQKEILAKVRSELFYLVQMLSLEKFEDFLLAINNPQDWSKEKLEEKIAEFKEENSSIVKDPRARNPNLTKLSKVSDQEYSFTHTILDEKDENDWFLSGKIAINHQEKQIEFFLEKISN